MLLWLTLGIFLVEYIRNIFQVFSKIISMVFFWLTLGIFHVEYIQQYDSSTSFSTPPFAFKHKTNQCNEKWMLPNICHILLHSWSMCWWSWSNVGLLCWYGMCWASRISLRQWHFKAFWGLGVYARQYIHSPTLWHRYWLVEKAKKGEYFWESEFLWSILFANFWNVHSPRLRRIGSVGQRIAWKFIIWLFMCCSFPFKLRLDFFLKLKWTQVSRREAKNFVWLS